jgi:integrase
MKAASKNRQGHMDATMMLVCHRHGLRVSELVGLESSQVDFDAGNLHVRRLKGSTDAVHPIRGDELRALRRLQREQSPIGLHVHQRAQLALQHRRLPAEGATALHGGEGRLPGSSQHAAPCSGL